jgi:hypothetical protein
MGLKKFTRTRIAIGKLSAPDLQESVQTNLEVAKEQIDRSRRITSDSRDLIMRVRLALAQSERIRLDTILQHPPNPMIAATGGSDYHEK